MRVVHVITRMILGGAQENTFLSCRDLMRTYGDDVLLITGPALGPEGSLMHEVATNRIPFCLIPNLRRSVHPYRDWQSYQQLKSVVRDFGPDVVHTHSAKGGILGRLAATALDIPAIIHTVHGAPFHPYQNSVTRHAIWRCEKYAAAKCHALISVADAMTDRLVAANVAPRDKFTTIYSGMDVQAYLRAADQRDRTRSKFNFEPHHFVIGKVARLFHLKGHEYVIRAANSVVSEFPNARFLFVGDGVLRNTLQREIDRAGLAAYFQFTGLVDRNKIPALISAMDIVVHTSLREGLARVLPQAYLVGRPAVSYDVDGAREVVVSDRTGVLLPPRSINELSAAIVRLARDPDLRKQMANEGRKVCQTKFSHEEMIKQIRMLYYRTIDNR